MTGGRGKRPRTRASHADMQHRRASEGARGPKAGAGRSRRASSSVSKTPDRAERTRSASQGTMSAKGGAPRVSRAGGVSDRRSRGEFSTRANAAPRARTEPPASSAQGRLISTVDRRSHVSSESRARSLFCGVATSISLVFTSLWSLLRKSRIATACLVVVLVLAVGLGVDAAVNGSTMRAGVSIGEVDVSGLTREQASQKVSDHYQVRLSEGAAVIFSDEETAASIDLAAQLVQDEAIAEQVSFEEAQKNKKLWRVDASTLGASLPVDALVDEAFSIGRGFAGVAERVAAALDGRTVAVRLDFDKDLIESLASDIDSAIGVVRVDYDVVVRGGVASVVEGHDGNMVNRVTFAQDIASCLLSADPATASFIATLEYAPLRIDAASAERTCDVINTALEAGATFSHAGYAFEVGGKELGGWIETEVVGLADGHVLVPVIDSELATPALVSKVNAQEKGVEVEVSITVSGDEVMVEPREEVSVPELSTALESLNDNLFGAYRSTGSPDAVIVDEPIEIATQVVSGPIDFDTALSFGIISEISSYTTKFVGTSATKNRTHNIHLVADLIDKSVAPADGGRWSFNEVAGNCDEAAGFLPAGAITGDEYIEEAGGGICQVATTVFNAVFDAGYAVPARTNHSLYVASYPAGRDAAVSYPDLDFVWRNDTASDVLLRATYTDSSITVTLYGVDPGYVVTSETGEWVEGEKHKTKTITDEKLAPGASYVKTAGTDGLEITVVRTVKSKDGDVVSKDVFESVYSPVTEIIVEGPGSEGEDAESKDAAAA